MFVALVIQLAHRLRRIVLSSVACLTVTPPHHYLINCTIFGGKKFLIMKCVFLFSLQTFSWTFLVQRRIQQLSVV